ncbi:hypothetical protein DSM43518_02303 [Mycobacterium marinum]|nr:hypothetical protein DSM43518_02303 [Mycobacterium marinum]
MTGPAPLTAPTAWVPDYLHGSLRHWQTPPASRTRHHQHHESDQRIHWVGRVQHLLDVALGRPPRSRCGLRLLQPSPTALLEDGAPLCPACATIAHLPTSQVEAFNHRGQYRRTPR